MSHSLKCGSLTALRRLVRAAGRSDAVGMKPSQIAALYQEKMPALLAQLKTMTGEQLAKQIQFFTFNLPAAAYLNFAQVHTIHHRGQLSVYLRPMGAKVPAIYGGSADEPMTAAQDA